MVFCHDNRKITKKKVIYVIFKSVGLDLISQSIYVNRKLK